MNLDFYIDLIKEKHGTQKRKQGTPYYLHPVTVCSFLAEKNFPIDYLITALFHDLLEDTNTTYEEILQISNAKVAEAVRILTKEKNYDMSNYIKRINKNDIAKMVKLADRLHNLSEAHFAPSKFQEKYIKETEDWYLQLAKGTVFEEDIQSALESLKKHFQNQMDDI